MLTKLTQAALSVVLTPVSVVADICMMPSTAYDGKHPFSHTKALVDNARRKTMEALGEDKS